MAVKKLGDHADSPLRKFVINHDKDDIDDIVDSIKVAIKRRMDDRIMSKEIVKLSKEVWDD